MLEGEKFVCVGGYRSNGSVILNNDIWKYRCWCSERVWEDWGYYNEDELKLFALYFENLWKDDKTLAYGVHCYFNSPRAYWFAPDFGSCLMLFGQRPGRPYGLSLGKKKPKTVVYFALDKQSNAIKIGYAVDPDERLKSIQTGNPNLIFIIKTTPGGRKEELKFHKQFASLKMQGEWFQATKELMSFIDSLPKAQ